jgi:hypothetical protein
MRRLLFLRITAFAATAMLAGCATFGVGSHTDRGLVWSKYKTFDWGPADALPAGDPRLDKDPYFQDRVEGAIERAMAMHGFVRSATTEQPDVLIHYHANIAERFAADSVDDAHGYCAGDDCWSRVSRYEAGTLVVDIVDAATNVLIWRGWAQGRLEGILGNGDRMRRRIDDNVSHMFETLAPLR